MSHILHILKNVYGELLKLYYLFLMSSIFCFSFLIMRHIFAAFIGWETKNKYAVTDHRGEMVYYVMEESGICSRLCLGKYRSCEFSIYDRNRQEILRMIRPFRCDSCCCPCYLQVASVPGFCRLSCLLYSFIPV